MTARGHRRAAPKRWGAGLSTYSFKTLLIAFGSDERALLLLRPLLVALDSTLTFEYVQTITTASKGLQKNRSQRGLFASYSPVDPVIPTITNASSLACPLYSDTLAFERSLFSH